MSIKAARITEAQAALSIASAAEVVRDVASAHAHDVDRKARFPAEAIAALRAEKLLSAAVPRTHGGMGASLGELVEVCETLGRACASSGMAYAMHCIQVASIVRHSQGVTQFEEYLRRLAEEQRLIASVTSEVGTGGDLQTSMTHLEPLAEEGYEVEKTTTASSYCEYADDLLLTARRHEAAAPNDQVLALLCSGGYAVLDVGEWDALGMRGTCSPPARIKGQMDSWQTLPDPFREIATVTMIPYSHTLWAGVWLGIAADAYERARRFLQIRSRKDPDGSIVAANRLAALAGRLSGLRARLAESVAKVEARTPLDADTTTKTSEILAINDLKLEASETVVHVVSEAMRVIGIEAYKNAGEFSLSRHLRDAHSAPLMINNDRVQAANADLLLVYKGR